jgi:YVTN family beta-propeller protein
MSATHMGVQWRQGWTSLSLVLCVISVLSGVTRAEAQTKAYVTSATTVTVIDTSTEAVLGTIPVGAGPARVAISPDGTRAYVSNRDSDSVSAIDTATDTVVATISVGDAPGALAVTPDGQHVYVVLAAGVVQAIDTAANSIVATITVAGSGGGVAITPDGRRAYVASGQVSVLDTATNTVLISFTAGTGSVTGVAISPDGSRAYFTTNGSDLFGGDAGVVVLDTSTNTVVRTVVLGALPGQIALAPDGSCAYVGIASVWVNTGYGAAFIPGRSVRVIDTTSNEAIASIDLGAAGVSWNLQNTAAGIAVTPDRSDVYVAVPRINSVAVINTSTHVVRQLTPVSAGAQGLAIVPDASATITPYVIDAVDDTPAFSLPSTGGTVIASVLTNDRLGGAPVTLAHVGLSQQSSTDAHITLDVNDGSVDVAPGAPLGGHSLVYRICERASPLNCDEAAAAVTVRAPYVIDAVNDSATARPGTVAIVSVLSNDTLNGAPPTAATVRVSLVSSTHAGVTLNPANGAVSVAPGTTLGTHALVYRICEIADPSNCDEATASVSVVPTPLDAVNDTGASTRSGGLAVANVLTNDRLNGTPATLTRVTLALVSSTHAGIGLTLANGAVTVVAGTPVGVYSLAYRICERANLANCDEATVTVTVNPYVINAVNDSARASRDPGTALASVLANDFLGNTRATTANVRLAFVSLTPANNRIALDLTDGSVDVVERTNSGLYSLFMRSAKSGILRTAIGRP